MEIKDFLNKIKTLQNTTEFDLSGDEDLSLAVMNLISLEEHFFFTGAKTKKSKYYELLEEIREVRKKLLEKLLGLKPEGELWCVSKHLLGASMRLIETGTKLQSQSKKKEAEEIFNFAYQVYLLFWKVKLGILDLKEFESQKNEEIDLNKSTQDQINELMEKLIDCCKE